MMVMTKVIPACVAALVLGSGGAVAADSALPPAVDAFVASAGALAKSAGDAVDLGRSNVRLNAIKSAFTNKISKASPGASLKLDGLDETALLCAPRGKLVRLAAQRNFVQSVASKVDEVGKPSQIENLEQAVGSLFASQSLSIKDMPDESAAKKAEQTIVSGCKEDLANFDLAYYGASVTPPKDAAEATDDTPSFAVFGPVGALVDTIVAIVTPVVIAGAKIVDEQKRRDVVLAYLTPGNIKKIQDAGRQLSKGVADAVTTKRRALAGSFNESLVALRNKTVDFDRTAGCKDFASSGAKSDRRPSGAPNDEAVRCWQAAWAEVSSLVATTLKDANDYDQLADAGSAADAQKSFDLMTKSLDAIVRPDADISAADLRKLWNWAVELVAFADKVRTAASPENQKKIRDAIDAISKAI